MQAGGIMLLAVVGVVVVMVADRVKGHGMMLQPIQRSSMWRESHRFPNSPTNYGDNQLFCGGFQTQWNQNGGRCGTCGDAYNVETPRPNEAGGEYATGVIVETYTQGEVIDVTVKITANHLGYFVFKLCPNNNVSQPATQQCLDQHVLQVYSSGSLVDTYNIGSATGNVTLSLQLPSDVTCTQCVLQWTYHTGNSWGCTTTGCCVGCGPQENFVNCADISITPTSATATPTTLTTTTTPTITTTPTTITTPTTTTPTTTAPTPTPTTPTTTTTTPTTTTTTAPTPTPTTPTTTTTTPTTTTTTSQSGGGCVAVAPYDVVPGMDNWCQINCNAGFCPASHCQCS